MLQGRDEVRVFEMVSHVALHERRAVLQTRERLPLVHQRGIQIERIAVFPSVIAGQPRKPFHRADVGFRERVIKRSARPPQEMHTEFPRRPGAFMEVAGINAEEAVKMIRKIRRAPFAHADDADLAAENDPHGELR